MATSRFWADPCTLLVKGTSSPSCVCRANHPADLFATPHLRAHAASTHEYACHHSQNHPPIQQKTPCHPRPNTSPPQAHRRPTTSPPHATISPTQAHHKPTIGSPQAHHRPNTSPPQAHHSLLPPTALSGLGTAPNFSPTLWHYML